VIFNRALISARYKNQGIYTRGNRLFRGVLDQGLSTIGSSSFGIALGRWKEASAKTSNGKDSFSYFLSNNFSISRTPI
jgi:hypothetical protein